MTEIRIVTELHITGRGMSLDRRLDLNFTYNTNQIPLQHYSLLPFPRAPACNQTQKMKTTSRGSKINCYGRCFAITLLWCTLLKLSPKFISFRLG